MTGIQSGMQSRVDSSFLEFAFSLVLWAVGYLNVSHNFAKTNI